MRGLNWLAVYFIFLRGHRLFETEILFLRLLGRLNLSGWNHISYRVEDAYFLYFRIWLLELVEQGL